MFDADSDDDDCRLMVEVWRQQEELLLRGVAVEKKATAEDAVASRMAKAPIDFIMVDDYFCAVLVFCNAVS